MQVQLIKYKKSAIPNAIYEKPFHLCATDLHFTYFIITFIVIVVYMGILVCNKNLQIERQRRFSKPVFTLSVQKPKKHYLNQLGI